MLKRLLYCITAIVLLGFVIPEPRQIPVQYATSADWHKDTFWYEPWGTSGVHKGVDIFAKEGTAVQATTHHIILFKGQLAKGGNVVLALGPKWRLHYYAHLASIDTGAAMLLRQGTNIGTVGRTGNAQGKAAHLHYSLVSLLPYFWLADSSTQGYKKAFYLNPIAYFTPTITD